jgi:hypothetical protein
MIFGVKPLMVSISQKLARECRDGTHVLAYRFPLPLAGEEDPNDNSSRVDKGRTRSANNKDPPLLCAKLIYNEEEMRIYECIGANKTNSAI